MRSTPGSFAQKVTRDPKPYLAVLSIFLTSRLIVALAIVFSAQLVQHVDGEIFSDVTPRWYRFLLRWDAGWYLKIASEGYSYNGNNLEQHTVGFSPLYPMLSRTVATVFGISDAAALLVVSNLALILAVLLVFSLIKNDHGNEVGLYAVSTLCLFPASFFFSAGYAESLTLLFIVTFFLFLKKDWFVLASVAAGLAAASRFVGVVLCLPLVIEIWRKRAELRNALPLGMITLVLSTSGLWLYVVYLWWAFRSPFLFLTARGAWYGNQGWRPLALVIGRPFLHLADILKDGPNPGSLAPWFFAAALLALIWFRKKLLPSQFAYGLAALLVAYITFSDYMGFAPFTRYILLAFPAFIAAGEFFKERVWIGLIVLTLFASMLFLYTALYAQFHWAG